MDLDYSNCKIYKIVCKNTTINDCYVGHTCNWANRKKIHKSSTKYEKDYNKEYNSKKSYFIRENGGWDNWIMVLIEKYPCENKHQAEAREQYWIDIINPTLNSKRSSVSVEQLKNEKIIYDKTYRLKNAELKIIKNKEYFEINKNVIINCECGCITNKFNYSRHKKSKIHQQYINSLHTTGLSQCLTDP
jgi:hypothetical protein